LAGPTVTAWIPGAKIKKSAAKLKTNNTLKNIFSIFYRAGIYASEGEEEDEVLFAYFKLKPTGILTFILLNNFAVGEIPVLQDLTG